MGCIGNNCIKGDMRYVSPTVLRSWLAAERSSLRNILPNNPQLNGISQKMTWMNALLHMRPPKHFEWFGHDELNTQNEA